VASEKPVFRINDHCDIFSLKICDTQYYKHTLYDPKLPETDVGLAKWIHRLYTVCCLPFCTVQLAKHNRMNFRIY